MTSHDGKPCDTCECSHVCDLKNTESHRKSMENRGCCEHYHNCVGNLGGEC
jgi:hypothetical protein